MITSLGLLWAIQKIRIHKSNPAQAAQIAGSLAYMPWVSAHFLIFSTQRLKLSDYWIWGLAHWIMSLDSLDYESRIPSQPHVTGLWITGLGLRLTILGSDLQFSAWITDRILAHQQSEVRNIGTDCYRIKCKMALWYDWRIFGPKLSDYCNLHGNTLKPEPTISSCDLSTSEADKQHKHEHKS